MPSRRRLHRALVGAPLVSLAIALPAAAPAAAAPTACQSAAVEPAAANAGEVESTILCLLNRERTSRGLKRLKRNPRLDRAAARHSRDMVARDFFGHVSPSGSTLMTRVKQTGYLRSARGWSVGENIGYGTGRYATPRGIVDAWMRSSGHRANILRRSFREIGIGLALGAPGQDGGGTYTTDFGTRL